MTSEVWGAATNESTGSVWEKLASSDPEAQAVVAPSGDSLTYRDLGHLVEDRAADLGSLGVLRSDRVAIVLPNGPHLATAFLSAARAACSAPLNPNLTESEYHFYLNDLEARVLLVGVEDDSPSVAAAEALGIDVLRVEYLNEAGAFRLNPVGEGTASVEQIAPQDTALVLHTSGTTARPKMVPLSK